ncbi:hypothetical protein CRUP_023497 [Coryphaenoides rupestris]|nr:hypothetical protein CRUP_023497 [Coryphaenoides rupestris]
MIKQIIMVEDMVHTAPQSVPAAAGGAAAGGAAAAGAGDKLFKSCWSCRLLSGGGLIAAAAYVMRTSTAQMRVGVPPTIGVVFQLTTASF